MYETFTYTITDEAGQTSTAQITIRIEGVNDAPNAVDDKETLDLDEASEITNLMIVQNMLKQMIQMLIFLIIFHLIQLERKNKWERIIYNSWISFTSIWINNIFCRWGYNLYANSGLRDTLKPGERYMNILHIQ